MRADRRTFMRILGGGVAFLSGGVLGARAESERWDVHQATRNTLFGALGARRPRLRRPPPRFKSYPEAERRKLPPLVVEPHSPLSEVVRRDAAVGAFDGSPLSLTQLGRLLHLTNGVTRPAPAGGGGPALRAAPSAGALYSGEVYVVAERVRGLAAGVYYYDVLQHELVLLRRQSSLQRLGRALEDPGRVRGAAAALLLTNVFERYTWRYANRGYRYALIDSGHIGENLRLAAASVGLGAVSFSAFHDDLLADVLGVDGRTEAVCALHLAGAPAGEAAAGDSSQIETRRLVQKRELGARVPFEGGTLIEHYHDSTKLVPVGALEAGKDRLPDSASAEDAAPKSPGAGVSLPRSDSPPRMSVEEAIQKRRSAERFEPASLALLDLSFALEMARGGARLAPGSSVQLYLAAHRVADLKPGLYRYRAADHRLELLRAGALGDRMVRVCLGQQKAGSAAVGFLMVAQLGPEGALAADRKYRDMLVDAGAVGQRLYLAAEVMGLAARNLAAFRDDDLNRLLGFDGRSQAVIHLTMLGPGY